jgi:hypothetical protein
MHALKALPFVLCVLGACATAQENMETPDAAGPGCGTDSTLCGSTCTALARDPQNCGACGTKCKDTEVCSMGKCALACGTGTLRCLNICVDAQSDPGNCGNCGVKCMQGEVCSMGKCAPSCAPATSPCGSACKDMQVDRTNCGACAAMCGAGEECVSGKCQLVCQTGLVSCPNNYGDAGVTDAGTIGPTVCVDTWIDRYNCGGCGTVCPPSAPMCRFGKCTLPVGPCAVQKCDSGSDVTNSNLKWVVCKADCNTAWVSMLSPSNGGQYHAEYICKQLGYNKFTKQGGTCGNVCGYCQGATSCNATGNEFYGGSGGCGSDQYGLILCNTVMWLCSI